MTQIFKSNINCSSCERMVANTLNEHPNIDDWSVNFDSPEKILSIEGAIDAKELSDLLNDLGFEIKAI